MRILVVHGEHADEYYDATTDGDLYRVALHILNFRIEEGYYGNESANVEPTPPPFSRDDVRAMPFREMADAIQTFERYEQNLKVYHREVALLARVQKIAADGDGAAAWSFLRYNPGGMYESVSLASVISIKSPHCRMAVDDPDYLSYPCGVADCPAHGKDGAGVTR